MLHSSRYSNRLIIGGTNNDTKKNERKFQNNNMKVGVGSQHRVVRVVHECT